VIEGLRGAVTLADVRVSRRTWQGLMGTPLGLTSKPGSYRTDLNECTIADWIRHQADLILENKEYVGLVRGEFTDMRVEREEAGL
jgi:hypothetical protein